MWVVSPKRKNTNKLNASHDLLFIIQSNANEEEFKQIFSDFITENGEFKRWEFSFISIKTVFTVSVPINNCSLIKNFKSNNIYSFNEGNDCSKLIKKQYMSDDTINDKYVKGDV
jgi:hypothetical protein